MGTFRKCTTAEKKSQRGCRPKTAVNDQPGKTQYIEENAAWSVPHIVVFGVAGQGDDPLIRNTGFRICDAKTPTAALSLASRPAKWLATGYY